MAELKGHYADRLWDAWKDYEKTHGALSGVELAARVQQRVGGIFDDTKLSRIRHKKRRATVEELIAISEELEVSFLWLARGQHTELPSDAGAERLLTRRKRLHRKHG